MRYNTLGNTGLFVSELCLGTMTFGGGAGIWTHIGDVQQADAERLIGRAIDAGINFIDTTKDTLYILTCVKAFAPMRAASRGPGGWTAVRRAAGRRQG